MPKGHVASQKQRENRGGETWDDRELTDLYREYVRYVGAIAQRILGHKEDAEDVVQDVFIDAAKGLRAVRDPAAVRGWLAVVTVRKARRRLRVRALRSFFRSDHEGPAEDIAAEGATPEDRAQLQRLYALLETAPVNERIAWVLRHMEGEKVEDVALRCECSLASAKRWIAKTQTMLERGMR